MTVEFENTEEKLARQSNVTSTPENNILIKIVSSQAYKHSLLQGAYNSLTNPKLFSRTEYPDINIESPLFESHIEENKDPFSEEPHQTATPISASDIEQALKYPNVSETMTQAEVIAAVAGVSGHRITTMYYLALTQLLRDNKITSLTNGISEIKEHEKLWIDTVSKPYLDLYRNIRLIDVPHLIGDIWKELRQFHSFVHNVPNSKFSLREGEQFKKNFMKDVWFDQKQINFEEKLILLHYQDIFDYSWKRPTDIKVWDLPLEVYPNFIPIHEKAIRRIVRMGGFNAQIKAQADTVLTGNGDKESHIDVIIDQKYMNGPIDTLFTRASRVQSLIYSSLAYDGGPSEIGLSELVPDKKMFLYHVFNTAEGKNYYPDATIYPDQYKEAINDLVTAATIWWFNKKELWEIKKKRKAAAVMPHLPSEVEVKRIFQPRLF